MVRCCFRSMCVCVCVCVTVCVSVRSGLVNNNSKTIKATDFKFDKHDPRDSPDMTPLKFFEKGRRQGHGTP